MDISFSNLREMMKDRKTRPCYSPWGRIQSMGSQRAEHNWATEQQQNLISKNDGFPDSLAGKESTCNAGDIGDVNSIPGSGRYPRGGKRQPTWAFLLENSHGQGSLAGYSPKGPKVLGTSEQLSRISKNEAKYNQMQVYFVYTDIYIRELHMQFHWL